MRTCRWGITRELSALAVSLLLAAAGAGGAMAAEADRPASGAATRRPLAPHVPHEVIVKFRDQVPESSRSQARSRVSASRLRAFRTLSSLEHQRLPGHITVEEALEKYRQDPDVLYAE